MTRGKKNLKSGDANTECPCGENFALNFLEALDDAAVADKLKKILSPDYDQLADVVAAKLSVRLKKLEDELEKKDEMIISLKKRLEDVENKLDDTEQYSRRTSVRISGIPEEATEDVADKVTKVFEVMKVKPVINRVHRVGPRIPHSKEPRPIICQFTTYPDKRAVMQGKKDIGRTYPKVFINEDLTRHRARIFFIARQRKRQGVFTDVWSADGRICAKDQRGKVHYITRLHELDKFDSHLTQIYSHQPQSSSAPPQTPTARPVQAPRVSPENEETTKDQLR